MTKNQGEKLVSFQGSDSTLTEFNDVWSGSAPFSNDVEVFRSIIADILVNQQIQSVDLDGIRENVRAKQQSMANKSFKIQNALQMYAHSIGDNALYKKVNISVSDLMKANGNASAAKAKTIEIAAVENITALGPYGITDVDVDALATSIAEFQASISAPKDAIRNRMNATINLKVLFKDGRTMIVKSLKKGVALFKGVSPDFYTQMMLSFRITSWPVRHTEMDFIFLDKTTKAVIPGVEVTAKMVENPSKVMKQFANINGEADFKEISPELWNMEFVIPDYVPVMQTLKAERAKKLVMTIEMSKI